MPNDKRLIDAKDFHLRVSERKMTDIFPDWKELPEEVKELICKHGKHLEMLLETQHTVDAVEVVQGRWVKDEQSRFEHRYNCSACNYRLIDEPCNYCPNCGAKMDGGADDA